MPVDDETIKFLEAQEPLDLYLLFDELISARVDVHIHRLERRQPKSQSRKRVANRLHYNVRELRKALLNINTLCDEIDEMKPLANPEHSRRGRRVPHDSSEFVKYVSERLDGKAE